MKAREDAKDAKVKKLTENDPEMVMAYWLIGHEIVRVLQLGETRAENLL